VQQIGHADAAAAHLVGEGRADTATGRADARFAAGLFLKLVEQDVVGHNHVGPLADEQLARGDPARF